MKLSLLHLHHEMMPYQDIDSNLNKLKEKIKIISIIIAKTPNPANFVDFFVFVYTHITQFWILMDTEIRKW